MIENEKSRYRCFDYDVLTHATKKDDLRARIVAKKRAVAAINDIL